MAISKLLSALACVAFALIAAPKALASPVAGPNDPVLTLSKSLYQVSDVGTATITGVPGHEVWLLTDKHAATTVIPSLGTFDLELGATLMITSMGTIPPTGILTGTFTPDCASLAAQTPTFIQAVSIDPNQGLPLFVSNLDVLRMAKGDECFNCPKTPIADPAFGASLAGTAVYLHGIGNDFVFAPGASFAEYGDGTARLTGEIFRPSAPTERFLFDTLFQGRVGPGEASYPPPTSPKMELVPAAYYPLGGPIDTDTWHYYPTFTGLLLGLDDFQGGVINIGRMGPSFQVGEGANGKDITLGGSAWMTVAVVAQPTSTTWSASGGGDINISIGDCPPLSTTICVTAATVDMHSPQQGLAPHAVVMFQMGGMAQKFLFAGSGGNNSEFPDGTARLKGLLIHDTNPLDQWEIDVTFSGRIDSGDPMNPPPGSPHFELLPTAYIWNGGPIDPALWHYYTDFSGTLKGMAALQGADVLITRRGPAFQVGDGANGKNINDGGSAWTWYDVINQPRKSPPLPLHTDGDINVDFVPCIQP